MQTGINISYVLFWGGTRFSIYPVEKMAKKSADTIFGKGLIFCIQKKSYICAEYKKHSK